MSGYLQRLVHTATTPAATVHPFAGSIFAVGDDAGPHAFELEQSETEIAETNAAAVPSAVPQREPEPHLVRDTPTMSEYRPIAPVSPSALASAEGSVEHRVTEQERLVLAARTAPASETRSERPPARHEPEEIARPLMPPLSETPNAPAPQLANRRASQANRPAAANKRESDEIQIHVGRIEVTAVHPPALRAPKAPDRSPSLDAYLSRRAR